MNRTREMKPKQDVSAEFKCQNFGSAQEIDKLRKKKSLGDLPYLWKRKQVLFLSLLKLSVLSKF